MHQLVARVQQPRQPEGAAPAAAAAGDCQQRTASGEQSPATENRPRWTPAVGWIPRRSGSQGDSLCAILPATAWPGLPVHLTGPLSQGGEAQEKVFASQEAGMLGCR